MARPARSTAVRRRGHALLQPGAGRITCRCRSSGSAAAVVAAGERSGPDGRSPRFGAVEFWIRLRVQRSQRPPQPCLVRGHSCSAARRGWRAARDRSERRGGERVASAAARIRDVVVSRRRGGRQIAAARLGDARRADAPSARQSGAERRDVPSTVDRRDWEPVFSAYREDPRVEGASVKPLSPGRDGRCTTAFGPAKP